MTLSPGSPPWNPDTFRTSCFVPAVPYGLALHQSQFQIYLCKSLFALLINWKLPAKQDLGELGFPMVSTWPIGTLKNGQFPLLCSPWAIEDLLLWHLLNFDQKQNAFTSSDTYDFPVWGHQTGGQVPLLTLSATNWNIFLKMALEKGILDLKPSLCHLLAVWPWASHFISLSLSAFSFENCSLFLRIKWDVVQSPA